MKIELDRMGRRGFLNLSAAVGGLVALGSTAGCAQGGGSGDGGYSGDVAITGLASLIHSAPFFIAESEGYYEEEGLTLEHVQFPGGLDTVRGIDSGIGFGTSSTLPVFIAAEKGMDVRMFGNVYTAASVDFITLPDSPIETIDDVRGRTIAVSTPGSNSSYFAERTLREAGLDPDSDVELVSVGTAADSWTQVSQGVVDVAWTASPLSEQIASDSGGKVIWRSRDYVTDWSDTCLVATGAFIDENADALRGWGKALRRAMKMISNDVETAADIYAKAIDYEPEVALEALKNSQDFFTLEFTDAELAAVVEAGKEQDQLKQDPDMDTIVMKDFLS